MPTNDRPTPDENEEYTCIRCGHHYQLRQGCEQTPHCDLCAHIVLEELERRLAESSENLKQMTILERERNETANVFMNQVKKLQVENTTLRGICGEFETVLKGTCGWELNFDANGKELAMTRPKSVAKILAAWKTYEKKHPV